MRGASDDRAGLPLEILAVWLLFAVVAVAVLVTYSRLDASELYHVSGSGLGGGASRFLVLLNFPIALVAIAVLTLLSERLGAGLRIVALAGIALCAPVFWPGVVDPGDLDARPVNAIAAAGVAIAVAITVVLWRSRGTEPIVRTAGRLRLAIAAVAFLLAVPWLLADLGLSLDGVPVLGTMYQTGELQTQPGDPILHPAVHHGHHHGMDGVLLVWSALLLAPLLAAVRTGWVRAVAGAYLALMFCYGAGNLANDFWLEQVVKRGRTDWEIPDVTEPRLSIAWGVIVIGAAALWALFAWRSRRYPPRV